jgi:transcriptional regulator with XRE-family HTH domain
MWTIGDAVHVDELGALIQRRMDEKGWTISRIARRSGLAVSTVHAWKVGDRARGSRGPSPDKLRQLAEGLELPVAVVFEAAGRRVPDELTPEDQRRFLHVLAELSEEDRKVLLATAEAMRTRTRS